MVLKPVFPEASLAFRSDVHHPATTDASLADANTADRPSLTVYPLPEEDGLIVKINPPRIPPASQGLKRTPCDIVLAIDVSGSMGASAPAPSNDAGAEDTGLSVLDLTKHAARTILETLDEGDRLGVVAYSSQAHVVQELVVMDDDAKAKARANIDGLKPSEATNMWHGILKGLELFRTPNQAPGKPTGRVPALMVLTDGQPNYLCPPQGYIPKLRAMGTLPAYIHTFGFGYHLRSGLLKSLAEIGGGNYAFIPDAGMIGTVFVHAVANLQATYAQEATLCLTYPHHLTITETTGETVDKMEPFRLDSEHSVTKIPLGSVMYGQSRDVYLRLHPAQPGQTVNQNIQLTAELTYTTVKSPSPETTIAQCSYADSSQVIPSAEIAYHKTRSELCAFLSSLFPIITSGERTGEHSAVKEISEGTLQQLNALIASAKERLQGDERNQSIYQDLCGESPRGQVSLALSNPDYWTQWGGHYLMSLLNAHARQICNSFKDPGPLQYGTQSALFLQCRDRLDAAFDSIPPPEPSIRPRRGTRHSRIQMSRYHDANAPCFAGSTPVTLPTGSRVPIRSLRRGSDIMTPLGPRKVAAVLVTPVSREVMCRVGDLIVTPWHPVSTDGKNWAFPAQVADSALRYTGCIYSLLLQPDRIPTAHAAHVGGLWGVTLGHGLVSGPDVRAHPFFGDFAAVVKSLRQVGVRRNGLVVGGGIRRDEKTGLVSGFRRGSGRVPRSIADVQARPGKTMT